MLTFRQLLRSRAARIAGFSYASFAANSVCGLVSIPLAVAHLGKEQIALWTLITQVVSYLMWMDLGVGSALGRKIADPISSGNQREINAWWTLSMAVLGSQGLLLLAVAAGAWPLWNAWFGIEESLRADALWLYAAAAVGAAISLPLRAYPGLLLAQQRYAWVPASQCLSPIFQLAVFAFFLHAGYGVKSYFLGMIAGHLAGWAVLLFAVHAGPVKVHFAKAGFTLGRALDLFRYSGSLAIIGLSQTVTQTLPSVMLGRFGGLFQIPVYTFSQRIPETLTNLTQRTTMAFYPAMQAHIVENRREHFASQFREVQGLSLSLGLLVAAIVLTGNRSFLSWLAAPDFYVGDLANFWFAVAALILPYGRTFTHLLQHSGDMGKSSLASFLTMPIAACFGWFAYQSHGIVGIAAVFAIIPPLIIGVYAAIRGSRNCGLPLRPLSKPGALQLAAYLLLLASAALWCVQPGTPESEILIFDRSMVLPNTKEWTAGILLITFSLAITMHHLHRIRSVSNTKIA
jgi:O-antigen/teichoic acid export membrane protein